MTVPARVLEVAGHEAVVDLRGKARRVSVDLLALEGAAPVAGDWVLLNAGMAVRMIDEHEAREVLRLLEEAT